MQLNQVLRSGIIGVAFSALMLLGACSLTVQPETEGGEATPTPASASQTESGEATAITEFVLPDGTSCIFSDTGTTVEFDGKQVNYTCAPLDASDSATQTLAILDEPFVVGPTEYFVDLATIAQTDAGLFELHASEVISFTAWEVVLADGRVCLHAGFGATMGFDGQRLNYTCDKGTSTAEEVGLMGELSNAGDGVWLAQIDEIGRDASGFVQLSSTDVAVSRISGAEVTPGSTSAGTSEQEDMRDELIGTTWQWVQTQYGDDSVEVVADPSRYTLFFDESGYVAVKFDCNGGGGPYTIDGSSLTFGAMISTLVGCSEDSQNNIFTKDLSEVYSYVIEDGHLFLSMKLDTGIMEFAPADAAATPTEEASEEAEATTTPTEEANEEAEATATPTSEANEEAAATVTPTEEASEEAETTATPTEEASEETETTATPTEEASEEGSMSSELAGTSWQWQQSIYEGDMVVAAADPSRYTLSFNDDGSVNVQLDCNQGSGTYTFDGSSLSFGPIASTRMACPSDSQDTEFSQDLAEVVSYAFADGNLHLTLESDGVMEFSPLE